MVRRLPFVLVLAGGLWFWKGGGGWFPRSREVIWQLPEASAEVDSVDLQLWEGAQLISREQLNFPSGAPPEIVQKVPLRDREYTARALLHVARQPAPTALKATVHVGADSGDTVLVRLR